MRYVDAGYAIALVALALYALSLLARRRRLERAAGRGLDATGDTSRGTTGEHETVRVHDSSAPDPRR